MYQSVLDMLPEDAAALRYLLATDEAHTRGEAALDAVREAEAVNMELLMKAQGFR